MGETNRIHSVAIPFIFCFMSTYVSQNFNLNLNKAKLSLQDS